MKRFLLLALIIALVPVGVWANYGKSNVLVKEIHRSPIATEPVPDTAPAPAPAPTPSVTPKPQAAPAAVPAPATPPAAPQGCTKKAYYPFTIHASSAQELGEAKRIMQKLKANLGNVFITKTDLGQTGIWYRVDYGNFMLAKDAVLKMRELQGKGIIDKDAFLGGPTPYTIELAAVPGKDAQAVRNASERFGKLGLVTYTMEESGGCVRILTGAFPDMKSARMALAEIQAKGITPTITKR